MKLIVCFNLFSLKKININREDFVLCNQDLDQTLFNYININNCVLNYYNYKSDFEHAINGVISESKLSKDARYLLESLLPNIYIHNLRFCIFWVQSFLNILELSFDEIIFTDFVDDVNYFPYYEAEGEVNRELLYEKYDFISSQLIRHAKVYCIQNKNCRITILNRHSTLILKIRIFTRRYFLLFVKVFFHFLKIICRKKNKILFEETSLIISTRSLAHSFGLESLLNRTDCIIHVCDGLSFSCKNHKYIKGRYSKSISQYQTLGLADLISSVKDCLFLLNQRNSLNTIDIYGVKIYLKSLFIEGCIAHLESILYAKSVFNLWSINNKVNVIINSELITPYSFWLKNQFLNTNTKVIQLQTVVIDRIPSPNFIFSDLLLFDSNKISNFFKNNQSKNVFRMDFWGNINFEFKELPKITQLNNIIYFTQPYEYDAQNEILLFLIKYTKKKKLNLFIKPHPREKFNNIPKSILKNLNILPKTIKEKEYLKFCDLAILRTSSLTQDFILKGIPVLNYINTSYDKSVLNLYLCAEEVNVCSNFIEMEVILNNFNEYLKDYYLFRKKYLDKLGIDHGLDDFIFRLNDLISQNTI